MEGTTLLFVNGLVYTEAYHHQQPAVSGPLRSGHVKVYIKISERVRLYRSFSSDSWSSSYFCESENVFDAPFSDLLRLNQMPADSLAMSNVNWAMESLGNPHPVVERQIKSLIQGECNAIEVERPVGPLSSPFSSMETVITIYARVIRDVYDEEDVEDERTMNFVVEESLEEAYGFVTRAADEEAVTKLERFVVREDEDDDDDDGETCTVCMDHMEHEDRGVRMPCEHVYHEDCIVKWLGVRCSCPVCRFQLASKQDDQTLSSDPMI